jgi:heme exporter protein A
MAAMSAPEAPLPHLWVSKLTVSRGERALFRDLDLTVPGGRCLLARGPNGAGKSSLLLALAGILRPETGTIEYRGAGNEGRERHIHFLGHQTAVKSRLTLAENLRFWVAVFGRSPTLPTVMAGLDPATQQNSSIRVRPGDDGPVGIAEALERVGLGGLDAIEAGHLSAGQTRRLTLARLLVARRDIWLLDEPTSSLDAMGEALVGALLSEHLARGGIAVVATHHDIPLAAGLPVETLVLH